METNDYNTLVENMKNNFIVNSKVSDLNEGSMVKTTFESVANVLEEAYIDTRLGFQQNLTQIATSIFNFKKKNGKAANVEVYFSRATPSSDEVIIPSNTIISDGTFRFFTSEVARIQPNEINSNTVFAQAEDIGTEYNVSSGTINTIEYSIPSSVVAVTNSKKAIGGADEESDTEMQVRFKNYINGLQGTNKYGIMAGLLANPKVRSISVVEDAVEETGADAIIYIDDGTGNLSEDLKSELLDIVNGTEDSTNPGLRAGGVLIDLEPCTQVAIDVEAKITLYRAEENFADAALKETVEKTINSLLINEDVIYADIITALKNTGSYVKNIKNLTLNSITNTDVTINEHQIARLGNVNFTYDYWE